MRLFAADATTLWVRVLGAEGRGGVVDAASASIPVGDGVADRLGSVEAGAIGGKSKRGGGTGVE